MDIEDFNARWLKAWTDKDVERLVGFYSPDTLYCDPQVPDGVKGREALAGYLTQLFGSTPPMTYTPHEVWTTHNGYCGRWYCEMGEAPEISFIRGFDLVELRDGLISLNEVYVHPVTAVP